MSQSIKQLQARARAIHARYMPSAIDLCSPSFLALVHSSPKCHLVIRSRKPACPMPAPVRPMSALASDIFAFLAPTVRPSDAFGSYEAINCAPSVGRNLQARA